MPSTVLSLVQNACYEQLLTPPSTLVGNTDPFALQLLNLFYATGRDLLQKKWWPQLKKGWSFFLVPGNRQYKLPGDYYSSLIKTTWDQQNKWEMIGPLTDREWNYRVYGYVTIENRKGFRPFGPDSNPNDTSGQFQVDPIPNANQAGVTLTFEYLSQSWLMPPYWNVSTAYTTANYVNNYGNIYKCSTNGTSATSNGPTLANSIGQDGATQWMYTATTNWGTSTAYSAGQYVNNSGNYYMCHTGGTSASVGSGPTTTAASITDGTVTWQYILAPAWAAETGYSAGTYVVANSNLYFNIAISASNSIGSSTTISGKVAPNFTGTTQVDGTATWTWQNTSYKSIITDSDLCLFDDSVMILGLRWRLLQARGLEYDDLKSLYDEMVDTTVARWQSGRVISLGGSGMLLAGLNPNIREGNFG